MGQALTVFKRRTALGWIASLVALAVSPAAARTRHAKDRLPPRVAWKGESRKRFRKRVPGGLRTDLAPGFYTNPRTGVTHYVTDEHIIAAIDPHTNVRRFRPANWEQGKHIALAELSFATEQHALAVLRPDASGSAKPTTSQIDEAATIILTGLDRLNAGKTPAPPWRLYDLLLGLAIRYDRPVLIEDMAMSAGRSPHRETLRESTAVWRAVASVLAQTPGSHLEPNVAAPANARIARWKEARPIRWPLPTHARRTGKTAAAIRWIYLAI